MFHIVSAYLQTRTQDILKSPITFQILALAIIVQLTVAGFTPAFAQDIEVLPEETLVEIIEESKENQQNQETIPEITLQESSQESVEPEGNIPNIEETTQPPATSEVSQPALFAPQSQPQTVVVDGQQITFGEPVSTNTPFNGGSLITDIGNSCTDSGNDFVFVLDNSGSIDSNEYTAMAQSVVNVGNEILSRNPFNKVSVVHYTSPGSPAGSAIYVERAFTSDPVTTPVRQGTGSDHLPAAMVNIANSISSGTLSATRTPGASLTFIIFLDAIDYTAGSVMRDINGDLSAYDDGTTMGVYNQLKSEGAKFAVVRFVEAVPSSLNQEDPEAVAAAIASTGGNWTGPVFANANDPDGSGTTPRRFVSAPTNFVLTGQDVESISDDGCAVFDTPVANDDFATTDSVTPIAIQVLENDEALGDISITNYDTVSSQGGTVTLNENLLVYTPNSQFVGEDTFTYTLCNGDTTPTCDSATVTVTVTEAANPAPDPDPTPQPDPEPNPEPNPQPNPGQTPQPEDDNDGITEDEENAGPNNGDGNGDGTPDSEQSNVATKRSEITGAYTTIAASNGCNFANEYQFVAEGSLSATDNGFIYDLGLHEFTLECGSAGATTMVSIVWDTLYDTTNWNYRKFNPNTQTYFDISNLVTYSTLVLDGTPRTVATYPITDGGELDMDGVANGIIVDPAGPAVIFSPQAAQSNGGLLRTGGDSIHVPALVVAAIIAVGLITNDTLKKESY